MVVLEHPLSGMKDSGQLFGPEVKVASTVASGDGASGDGARKLVWLEMRETVNVLVSSSSGSSSVFISPGGSSWVILSRLVSWKR